MAAKDVHPLRVALHLRNRRAVGAAHLSAIATQSPAGQRSMRGGLAPFVPRGVPLQKIPQSPRSFDLPERSST